MMLCLLTVSRILASRFTDFPQLLSKLSFLDVRDNVEHCMLATIIHSIYFLYMVSIYNMTRDKPVQFDDIEC